ncbi:glycoside hydrolase family 16 protein [Nakamurella leprariae]|uniref:Glycoside hydrolase family 16 protein n=1 Tax=Nakamurella leprariae TaxID=2803911 RepID=A0A938Y762_9ACTN|nr:glycoside hydrolase family 16 protein [Nakamurella leprariae]MBM9467281.1 glycoside hydrolase family 16 protein [Nakamurella leprariae]
MTAPTVTVTAQPPTSTPPTSTSTSTPPPVAGKWRDVYFEGFDREAPLGQVGQVYGGAMRGYADGARDTSKRGLYDPDRVLSVKGGVLDWWVRTINGQPLVATPVPADYLGQTYGRYEVRFRADPVPGFKTAFLLWPSDTAAGPGDWNDGEIDFPEGNLNGSIFGYSHDRLGDIEDNAFWVSTGKGYGAWQTAVIEWEPNRLAFYLDGRLLGETSDPAAIPIVDMRLTLQVETGTGGEAIPASAQGHVQVDSVRIQAYTG